MSKKGKKTKKETMEVIKNLIKELKKYDDMDYSREADKELKKVKDKLVSIGKPAVTELIEVLNEHRWQSSWYAAVALGEIGDKRAIVHLVNALEEPELGEVAKDSLKKFGPVCIPEVIKKVEYRIQHPLKDKGTTLTMHTLGTIGEIKCDKSIQFLNRLLDDYASEMPDEPFDPTKRDWKYRNFDFFDILDCMVRQQDKRAIPHIRKVRDLFPKNYTDYIVCQIAIGRIKKGKVEGYLPLEALEISMPSGAIMEALSGGEFEWEDTFEDEYGEYLEDDEDDEEGL